MIRVGGGREGKIEGKTMEGILFQIVWRRVL